MDLNTFKIEKCAKLVLNTQLFFPNGNNGIAGAGALDTTQGSANNERTSCNFKNINWRVILGDMYDEYETFNLVLIGFDWLSTGGTSMGIYNKVLYVEMTGLDWLNQTYNPYTKCINDKCVIHIGGNAKPVYNTCTFRRPAGNGISDVILNIRNSWDNSQNYVGDRTTSYQYLFNIYGVDKVKK